MNTNYHLYYIYIYLFIYTYIYIYIKVFLYEGMVSELSHFYQVHKEGSENIFCHFGMVGYN